MPPHDDHVTMRRILEENAVLIKENNKLLKKIHKYHVWGFAFRMIWFFLLIGLPFALYFYVVEPYFAAFGASYETFRAGLNEIPGLKGLEQLLNALAESGGF